MSRLLLPLAVVACVPADGIATDAGLGFADLPKTQCGLPYTPCCADELCLAGWRCRGGACIAPAPRCVATGIADPETTRGIIIDPFDSPNCAAVPEILRLPDHVAAYRTGDDGIAQLECEGLEEGGYTLHTRLRVRMTIPERDSPLQCFCDSSAWNVGVYLSVVEGPTAVLPGLMGGTTDGSCRRGPDVEHLLPVRVGGDGRFRAQLDLTRCIRWGLTTVCQFVEGTSMTLERP